MAEHLATVTASAEEPAEFLRFIGELRECTAQGQSVAWSLSSLGGIDPSLLYHLWPPGQSGPADSRGQWRSAHHFGMCYYRRGPGFVLVHDERPAGRGETLIDQPADLDLFDRLREPGPVSPDEPGAARLRELRLILEIDGLAIALPYRERRLAMPTSVL